VRGLDQRCLAGRLLNHAFEKIGRADEIGHELGLGVAIDVLRGAALNDPSGIEDRDLVGERQRLGLIVSDINRGHAQPLLQALELDPHLLTQLGIKV